MVCTALTFATAAAAAGSADFGAVVPISPRAVFSDGGSSAPRPSAVAVCDATAAAITRRAPFVDVREFAGFTDHNKVSLAWFSLEPSLGVTSPTPTSIAISAAATSAPDLCEDFNDACRTDLHPPMAPATEVACMVACVHTRQLRGCVCPRVSERSAHWSALATTHGFTRWSLSTARAW